MAVLSLCAAYVLFFSSLFAFAGFVFYSAKQVSLRGLLSPGSWFLSAPESVGWGALGLSLYASFMGNWVLYLPPLVGALYGWPGIGGYALSSCLPYLLLLLLSPRVCSGSGSFCSCDFLGDRFGCLARGVSSAVSVCMMFLNLCSELTSVGLSMSALSDDNFSLPCAVFFVCLVPLLYVGLGGVRCSIISDVFQAVVIVLLFIPLTVYLVCFAGVSVSEETVGAAETPEMASAVVAGAVLVLSIWPVFLLDQGIWQRLLASKSSREMQLGLLLAAGLAGASVLLFAAAGRACLSPSEAQQGRSLFAFAAAHLPQPWVAVLCVLAVACVVSSVDTYQVAAVSVIGRELERHKNSFNWARLMMLLLNVLAVALAIYQVPLMKLFMCANFLCAILSGPFLLSVHPKTTSWGFLGGLLTAAVGLLLCGLAAAKAAHTPFSFSFFVPEDISTLPYLFAFLVAPLAGAAGTAIISLLDRHLNKRSSEAATAAEAAAAAATASDTTVSFTPLATKSQPSSEGISSKEFSEQDKQRSSRSGNNNNGGSNSSNENNNSNSSSCQAFHPFNIEQQAAGVENMA